MKKGFTLVELLAVIVILAVIALIAVPVVLNIVDDSKETSDQRSMELYVSAVDNASKAYMVENDGEVPTWENISGVVRNYYSGPEITCRYSHIFENGDLLLSECTIAGKEVDFTYGKLMGDGDGDGKITSSDVKLLSNIIAGSATLTESLKTLYDLNGDGLVNSIDANILSRILDGVVPGDLNKNGYIDDYDLETAKEIAAGIITPTAEQEKITDVNFDGDINSIDTNLISRFLGGITYPLGDINGDGYINNRDVSLLTDYIAGKQTLTEEQKSRADLNDDEKINGLDVNVLKRSLDKLVLGDLDNDGYITDEDRSLLSKYMAGAITFTESQVKAADLDGNGKINPIDSNLLSRLIVANQSKNLAGDLNGNGLIDNDDKKLLTAYIAGISTLTSKQMELADLNEDGQVNPIDSNLLSRLIAGVPVNDIKIAGDLNGDNVVTDADSDLLTSYLAGTSTLTAEQQTLADLNEDGVINTKDAFMLKLKMSSN